MPLVISEIRVQMRVSDAARVSGETDGCGGESAAGGGGRGGLDAGQERLVAECVRRVLRAINTLEER